MFFNLLVTRYYYFFSFAFYRHMCFTFQPTLVHKVPQHLPVAPFEIQQIWNRCRYTYRFRSCLIKISNSLECWGYEIFLRLRRTDILMLWSLRIIPRNFISFVPLQLVRIYCFPRDCLNVLNIYNSWNYINLQKWNPQVLGNKNTKGYLRNIHRKVINQKWGACG